MIDRPFPEGGQGPAMPGTPMPGTLYLIPVPLGPDLDPRDHLPSATQDIIGRLGHFVAENAKSARAVLRQLPLAMPLQSLSIEELNQHTPANRIASLLTPITQGHSLGLMSEAGCPAVADPGAALVALAHQLAIPVVPLVGPSSILLALMASGLSGQSFAFVGYLPVPAAARLQRIQALERRALQEGQTQIVIETPYRNQALFEAFRDTLSPDTLLGVASDLTTPRETIRVAPVSVWRERHPELPRCPTVFTLGAPGEQATPGGAIRKPNEASGSRRKR